MEVSHDDGVAVISAGHGDGLEAVEFVSSFLGTGPGEELILRPWFAERRVHG
jgi:hypothetical protein